MTPFSEVTSPALALLEENIDTDQIIPARFLRKPRSSGYHNYLLYDARYDSRGAPRPDSPISETARDCHIVLAGHNIGCGSSREGAVYAFVDHGVRVIISTKIADIFRSNAVRNGLLPINLPAEAFAKLVDYQHNEPDASFTVDLTNCEIRWGEAERLAFDIDEGSRQRLLHGIDDIQATLKTWHDTIQSFSERYLNEHPWIRRTDLNASRFTSNNS